MFSMDLDLIQNKVFKMLDVKEFNTDQKTDSKIEVGVKKFRYVQIKRPRNKAAVETHEQIQVIDVTARVKFDFFMVERRIQELINAMVSHELRNPLNSIQNQTFLQKCINEKIEEIINDETMCDQQ